MHLRMLPTKYEKEIVNYSSNHYKYGLLELYTIKNFPSIKTAYIPISWNIAVLHIPKKSSSHVYPHALTAYITGLLLTVYVVRIKKLLSFMLSYSHNVLKYIST